jgi:four helix bundle protein
MSIRNFRDLRVWQTAMDLVEQIYRSTAGFPKQETFGLTAQMRRAAVSIPSNIAEGHTREHRGEFLQHLSIAQASLAELQTHLEIASRLKYCPGKQLGPLLETSASLTKQLYALRNALLAKGSTV